MRPGVPGEGGKAAIHPLSRAIARVLPQAAVLIGLATSAASAQSAEREAGASADAVPASAEEYGASARVTRETFEQSRSVQLVTRKQAHESAAGDVGEMLER